MVAPLARGLDRGLDRLGAGVHRQHHVLAGELGQPLREGAELVVVERPAGQGEAVQLRLGGLDEPRVPVPEVERRVRRQQVEVALALDVGDPGTLAVGDDDRERVVVVRAVALDLFAWIHGGSLAPQSP